MVCAMLSGTMRVRNMVGEQTKPLPLRCLQKAASSFHLKIPACGCAWPKSDELEMSKSTGLSKSMEDTPVGPIFAKAHTVRRAIL